MFTSDIVEVWGEADNLSLYFQKNKQGLWEVEVPPDTTDGTYAVTIRARNESNLVGSWAGYLYMHNGRACFHLVNKKYTMWMFCPDYVFDIHKTTNLRYEGSCIHCKI